MKILILGGDGYLGWPTAMYLSKKGYEVAVVDNMIKHFWEAEVGTASLNPNIPLHKRISRWKDITGNNIKKYIVDIAENPGYVYKIFDEFKPDVIVHYAEQPSAPFSMIDRAKCISTQQNNINGTLNILFAIQHTNPDIHIIKLGTMGEYGTPNIDIEEGWLEIEHNGRKDRMMYPKKPHSFYHLSKVHDSNNLEFACRVWGARVTDLNQGAVYGVHTDETKLHPDLYTSFHYDSIFGTVLNRFCIQAIASHPLTVYGKGSQTRGFLNIKDTLKCVELAIENPAEKGEFRVFNQFTEQFSINELAQKVKSVVENKGSTCDIEHIKNPRVEEEDHYYNAKNSLLPELGLNPEYLDNSVIEEILEFGKLFQNRIDNTLILPKVQWAQNSE
jgi:UDP-sulfoquinovose synthase